MSSPTRRRFLSFAAASPAAGAAAQIIGGGAGWSIRGTDPVEIFQGERRVAAYRSGYPQGLPFLDPIVGPTGALFTAPLPPGEVGAEPGGDGGPAGALTGLWFALDGVNGRDFHPAPQGANPGRMRGRIVHTGMNGVLMQGNTLTIRLKSEWMAAMDGGDEVRRVCSDWRELVFSQARDGALVVDFLVELMADAGDLEIEPGAGALSLRLHPGLVWKEGGEVSLRNSEGLADGLVPGKRARWIACQGADAKGGPAGLAAMDHPGNPGAPASWNLDGDGVLSADPQARSDEDEDDGDEALRHVPNGESRTFRYRLLLHAGATDPEGVAAAWESFAGN